MMGIVHALGSNKFIKIHENVNLKSALYCILEKSIKGKKMRAISM